MNIPDLNKENAVSPVIGVLVMVGLVVAVASLASVVVFDLSFSTDNAGQPPLDVQYESESAIQVQLLKDVESTVIVQSALGTEYTLNGAGDSVTILNQEGNQTPVALAENGDSQSVIRQIPPRSFTPDAVVNEDESVQTAVDGAQDGDIIVVEKSTYSGSLSIGTNNVTVVGEEGTVLDSSSAPAVDVTGENVRISNIEIRGNGAGAGVDGRSDTQFVRGSVQNAGTPVGGGVQQRDGFTFVRNEQIESEDNSGGIGPISSPSASAPDSGNYSTILSNMEGDGTQDNPYVIMNDRQLQAMKGGLGKHYELGQNINASKTDQWNGGSGFKSVGGYNNGFTGTFDGRNYTIDGLTIDRGSDKKGLFGDIGSGAIVKNVGVINVDITGNEEVGGLVGDNSAIVKNSYATGDVTGGDFNIGGLVGTNRGTVQNSYATGNVTGGNEQVGGLVGINLEGTIENSYATGDVTANEGTAGGLVGYHDDGTVQDSYATGDVSGDFNIGGLVGFNNQGEVQDSYWDSESTGQSSSDGLPDSNGLTTTEMQGSSASTNMDAFDFQNTWKTVGGEYPVLRALDEQKQLDNR